MRCSHKVMHVTRAALAALLAVIAVALPGLAAAQSLRPHVEVPDEPVRSVLFRHCSSCHGIDPYAYHALDSAGWRNLLEDLHPAPAALRMSDSDEALLLGFLVEQFGPATVPFPRSYVAPEVSGLFTDADARVFLDQVCTECHELRVFRQRHTLAGWRNLILEMRENGAILTDENVERLAEWLGRVQGEEVQ
jgi:hypothetical protein